MQSIPARWFTAVGPGRHRQLVVLHSMESPDKPDTAEAVAAFFQRLPADRKASAHVCVDMNSAVRCVDDNDVAYGAPGANSNGLHIELAGYARYAAGEWSTDDMRSMLDIAAGIVGDWCHRYDIPVRFVDAAALKRGEFGITTHFEVSQAFKQSDHWDPGKGFPIADFIARLKPAPVGEQGPELINVPTEDDDMLPKTCLNTRKGGSARWVLLPDGGIANYDGAEYYGNIRDLPENDRPSKVTGIEELNDRDGYIVFGLQQNGEPSWFGAFDASTRAEFEPKWK